MQMTESEKESIKKILLKNQTKEYYCHIQFVLIIAKEIAEKKNIEPRVIEFAALLHDIGRGNENEGETHEIEGARIAEQILKNFNLTEDEKKLIIQCISNHNANRIPQTIEEKIIITADSASKIIYHEAFMLLCKKTDYDEKARWGLKYLEKGMKKIMIDEYKEITNKKYEELKKIYEKIR